MSTPAPQPYYAEDEIDLRQIWQRLMKRKLLIVLTTLLAGLGTGVSAFLMTPIFRAEVLLQPVTEQKTSGLGGLAGSFGGLAALAGVSLDGLSSGGSNKSVAIATLKSRALTEQFILDKDLLPILFREDWDEEKKDWRASDTGKTPTVQDAYRVFDKGVRTVTEDKKSGLVTLAIEWRDPKQAADWAGELVKRTNLYLQEKTRVEVQNRIEYLEQQARQTSLLEVRETIFKLMEKEMNQAMLAKVSDEFAFKTIDPAVVPEKKVRPKRALMTALGTLAGFFIAVFYVLVRASFEENPQRPV